LGIGRSGLIDPLGHTRARLSGVADLLLGTVDTELVRAVRARVPIL
jgi:hypothetical protein